jgi:hypothetical protein
MFSVGVCARCSTPLCGQHGTHDSGGYFVCVSHVQEDGAAAAADRERAAERTLAEAKEAVEREKEALRAALPGFPVDQADGRKLANALERLVPDKKELFVTEQKSFGRTSSKDGWGFAIEQTDRETSRWKGLVVLTDCTMHTVHGRRPGRWRPDDLLPLAQPSPVSIVRGGHLRAVIDQVLNWRNARPSQWPTLRQRYLVEFEKELVTPNFDVWASQRQPDGRMLWMD